MIQISDGFCPKKMIIKNKPLIHCITNHISINDSANVILALGAKPIMAEYSGEVEEITAVANSLCVNLGNISEERIKSFFISGKKAFEKGIPCIIDIVGVACSRFRLEISKKFIDECCPCVIKGNEAEIRALNGSTYKTIGVDSQCSTEPNSLINLAKTVANKFNSVVLISGKVDVVSDGRKTCLIENGSPLLTLITGTGCVQGAICGTYLAVTNPFQAAVSAAVTMGIAGEFAEKSFKKTNSLSDFKAKITDAVYFFDDEYLSKRAKVKLYE